MVFSYLGLDIPLIGEGEGDEPPAEGLPDVEGYDDAAVAADLGDAVASRVSRCSPRLLLFLS